MGYDAVVFDNDGVLVELTDLDVVRAAIRETFAEFGVDDPAPEAVEGLIGVDVDGLRTIAGAYDLDPAPFWNRRDLRVATAQCERVRRGEKAPYDDVSALEALDRPLGVVSNNQQRTVDYVIDRHFDGRFRSVYGREPTLDGIRRKKPSPYYLDRVIDELGTDDVLYVGDSNVDVAAAEAAGVDAAFLRRPHRAGYDLEREPTHELDSLDDLVGLV